MHRNDSLVGHQYFGNLSVWKYLVRVPRWVTNSNIRDHQTEPFCLESYLPFLLVVRYHIGFIFPFEISF